MVNNIHLYFILGFYALVGLSAIALSHHRVHSWVLTITATYLAAWSLAFNYGHESPLLKAIEFGILFILPFILLLNLHAIVADINTFRKSEIWRISYIGIAGLVLGALQILPFIPPFVLIFGPYPSITIAPLICFCFLLLAYYQLRTKYASSPYLVRVDICNLLFAVSLVTLFTLGRLVLSDTKDPSEGLLMFVPVGFCYFVTTSVSARILDFRYVLTVSLFWLSITFFFGLNFMFIVVGISNSTINKSSPWDLITAGIIAFVSTLSIKNKLRLVFGITTPYNNIIGDMKNALGSMDSPEVAISSIYQVLSKLLGKNTRVFIATRAISSITDKDDRCNYYRTINPNGIVPKADIDKLLPRASMLSGQIYALNELRKEAPDPNKKPIIDWMYREDYFVAVHFHTQLHDTIIAMGFPTDFRVCAPSNFQNISLVLELSDLVLDQELAMKSYSHKDQIVAIKEIQNRIIQDMRALISPMRFNLETLMSPKAPEEVRAQLFKNLKTSIGQLNSFAENIFSASVSRDDYTITPFAFCKVFNSIFLNYDKNKIGRNYTLRYTNATGLDNPTIMGDSNKLRFVFENIIKSLVEALESVNGPGYIQIDLIRTKLVTNVDVFKVLITSNGDFQAFIFDAKLLANTSAITTMNNSYFSCRDIIHRHRGTISIEGRNAETGAKSISIQLPCY